MEYKNLESYLKFEEPVEKYDVKKNDLTDLLKDETGSVEDKALGILGTVALTVGGAALIYYGIILGGIACLAGASIFYPVFGTDWIVNKIVKKYGKKKDDESTC